MSIKETVNKIIKKELSAKELVKEHIENVNKYDPKINAFITRTDEKAMENAIDVDNNGKKVKLAGIPMALKDNISVKDVRMTASSRMLEDYIPPYNATVAERLNEASLIGKTNLDSFAFGASTENSGYFVTKNPWDISRVAGGSSGGSTAAVAAGMSMFAIGTDTGGSIRQPAAFCGVVGLKPTYGRSSRYGLAAMGSSLDCPGPITKNVEDAAYILNLISGYDERDATSMPIDHPDFTAFSGVKGKRVGLPKEFFSGDLAAGMDIGLKDEIMKSVEILSGLGMEIVEISIPHIVYSLPVYYIITPSEISANMSRYDGIRYGHTSLEVMDVLDMYLKSREAFEDEVKRRIYVGNYALSSGYFDAYYNKAMQVRTLILNEMSETFKKVDVIVGPTTPTPSFKIGENTADPVAMYLADIFTVTANIAGLPSISIPCGLANNLPVGFQIMAKQFDEKTMLDVSFALEQEIQFNEKYSPDLTRL